MLNLGLTEESDGGLVGLTPDGGGGELKGIVVLEYGVGLGGNLLEIIHGGRGGHRGLGGRGGSEGGGRGQQRGEDGELHG